MNIFGRGGDLRGCFIKWNMDLGSSKGAGIAIYGAGGSVALPNNSDAYLPIVITAVDANLKESVARLRCFRGRTYTYAFGADLGSVVVSMTTFLNRGTMTSPGGNRPGAQSGSSDSFATMLKLYNMGRISQSKKEAILNIGTTGEVLRGQIDFLRSSTANQEYNLQLFQLGMTVIPAAERDSSGGGGDSPFGNGTGLVVAGADFGGDLPKPGMGHPIGGNPAANAINDVVHPIGNQTVFNPKPAPFSNQYPPKPQPTAPIADMISKEL